MNKSTRRAAGRRSPTRSKTVKARKVAKAGTKGAPKARVAPAADPFYLKLDASCTLREVADLQFSLVAANGDPVEIDGGSVERIDTAGLQLLVALARRQQQAGRRLTWKSSSQALLKCGERLGLMETLGLAASLKGEVS